MKQRINDLIWSFADCAGDQETANGLIRCITVEGQTGLCDVAFDLTDYSDLLYVVGRAADFGLQVTGVHTLSKLGIVRFYFQQTPTAIRLPMSKHIPIVLPPRKLEAILQQKATQFRVMLSPQPPAHLTAFYGPSPYRKGFEFYDDNAQAGPDIRKYPEVHCPYGKRGDLLYVQEEWSTIGERSQDLILKSKTPEGLFTDRHRKPWQPPETMPKKLARHWLKVTEVQLERLQSISKADAIAEGPVRFFDGDLLGFAPAYVDFFSESGAYCLGARSAFKQGWRAVHGAESWSTNPWVFAVSFAYQEDH